MRLQVTLVLSSSELEKRCILYVTALINGFVYQL